MEIIYLKAFLIAAIILYLVGLTAPLIILKRKGIDPHGTHGEASLLTRLSAVSIILWLIYVMLYLFFDTIIMNIWCLEFIVNDVCIIAGFIIIVPAFIFEFLGTLELGVNFRIELPKEKTELITSGIYRLMRNPIVFGVFLLLIGSFLMIPTIISLILLIFNIITFNSKVKDEEKFLSERFGEKYENYRKKVGRYLPFPIKKT